MIKFSYNQSGFALLLSVVVASIVLAIGLTMLSLMVKQLTLSSVSRESELAFHAANGGVECLRYWHEQNISTYIDNPILGAPDAECFGGLQDSKSEAEINESNGAYINRFSYQYDWDSGEPGVLGKRCTEVDMFVMVATTNNHSNYTYDFSVGGYTDDVGNGGVKECQHQDICTVVVSRGYNRSCLDLKGLATVQREVTAEF